MEGAEDSSQIVEEPRLFSRFDVQGSSRMCSEDAWINCVKIFRLKLKLGVRCYSSRGDRSQPSQGQF